MFPQGRATRNLLFAWRSRQQISRAKTALEMTNLGDPQ